MTERLYRNSLVQKVLSERRRHRVKFMLSRVDIFPRMRILDVGCGPDGRSLEVFLPNDVDVVGIDLYVPEEVHVDHPRFRYAQQDASDLIGFSDKSFDLTFCIGMLEHICQRSLLETIALEIERVSRQYVIVVPWKWAWVEPHFKFPVFQLLPFPLKLALTRSLNLHGLGQRVREDPSYISSHYQWLSNEDWKRLFPGSRVYTMPSFETIAIVKRLKSKDQTDIRL